MSSTSLPQYAPQAPQYAKFAKGWFVVCFSDELAVGATKCLRYFGRNMVAYRGEDGVARVLDAYCPHLGAHLGVGGKVVGATIQCPFHAWRFGEDGRCVDVPYSKKIPPGAKVGAWLVREVNGTVLVHHDAAGGAPEFDVPVIAEHGTSDWLPWSRSEYHIKTQPREVVENLADKAHFPAVHDTEINEFAFEIEAHMARQRVKGRALLRGGGVDNFSSTTTYYGPGFLIMRMDGALQNYMLFAHTPIDEGNLDLRLAVMLKIVGDRGRTEGYVKQYVDNLRQGFEDDIRIWENKVYREQPAFCDGDGPVGKLRRWYKQFYAIGPQAAEPEGGALRASE